MLADSSFYLCFLEDIAQPEVLLKILQRFDFLITPTVYKEVSKSNSFGRIQSSPKLKLLPKESLGEILKPFFSKKEIEKGETEVIELAYEYYVADKPKTFIIDDKEPRLFVLRNLPYLSRLMIGTVGFVGECCYVYSLMDKNEATTVILLISASNFRAAPEIISEVLHRIENG
jgi:predicted nucleic acid-binding protein